MRNITLLPTFRQAEGQWIKSMLEIMKKLMASATTWDWDAMGAPNWLEVTTWEDPAEALVYAGLTLGCCEATCFGISRVKILWIRQGPMLSLWAVDSTLKQECSSGGSRQSNRDSHVPKLYHTWPKKKPVKCFLTAFSIHCLAGTHRLDEETMITHQKGKTGWG